MPNARRVPLGAKALRAMERLWEPEEWLSTEQVARVLESRIGPEPVVTLSRQLAVEILRRLKGAA